MSVTVIMLAIIKNLSRMAYKSSKPLIASKPISIIPYGIRGRNVRPKARGVRHMTAEDMTLTSGG